MKKIFLAVGAAAILLTACADPKEAVLPVTLEQMEGSKDLLKKLNDEEKRLLVAYLTRREMAKVMGGALGNPEVAASFDAATVGDAIAQQREFQAASEKKAAEEEALRAKVLSEQKALQEQVDKALTVAVVDLHVRPQDIMNRRFRDEQVIVLALHNTSDREIAGVSGMIDFVDMFDKTVGSVHFKFEDGIKPGATEKWTGTREINQFEDEHTAIARLVPGKFTGRFRADGIVFADGTKLNLTK